MTNGPMPCTCSRNLLLVVGGPRLGISLLSRERSRPQSPWRAHLRDAQRRKLSGFGSALRRSRRAFLDHLKGRCFHTRRRGVPTEFPLMEGSWLCYSESSSWSESDV